MKKYIVRDGDNMWAISKRTGVRVNLLMAANPHISDPNSLTTGQIIMVPELTKKAATTKPVPSSAAPAPAATTPSGASDATTPPMPSSHHGYQTPHAAEPMPAYFGFVWPHVVGPNETWHSIAAKYGLSQQQLQHLNPSETPATLHEGDVLYIPALGPTPQGMSSAQPGPPQQGMPSAQPGPAPQSQGMPPSQPTQMQPAHGWQSADPSMTPAPPYYGRPGDYDGYPYPYSYPYPYPSPYPYAPAQQTYPGADAYMRGMEGMDDDEWEWQSWGWSDVHFTNYQLPRRNAGADGTFRD